MVGRGWRMRFQIHLQELQERLAFAHGDRKAQCADVFRVVFEFETKDHFICCLGVGKHTGALIVDQQRD